MFKKFTETLTGTLDTVKSYGSSMVIGQAGQGQDGQNNGGVTSGKLSLNLPILGNGSVSAPATVANSPTQQRRSANPFSGIQNTIEKFTGRGDSTNAVVMATQQQKRQGRGPALGMAVEVNDSRMTQIHDLDDHEKVSSWHDIDSFAQYKKVSDTGQMKHLESQIDGGPQEQNGGPKLVRSNTDEIIDQEFKNAQVNLDDVLDMAEYVDELTPVKGGDKDDGEKKPKKKKNKHLTRCIRCIQDNRVKGGCVDPEDMRDQADQNLVLKKVLNIIFLIIGSCLFAAVFVVIIYTSLPSTQKQQDTITTTEGFNNSTLGFYDYTVPLQIGDPYIDLEDYNDKDRGTIYKIRSQLDRLQRPQPDWIYE